MKWRNPHVETAQWFDETDAAKKLADSSVAKLLFKDIKGEKL